MGASGFDLERFAVAQAPVYADALAELRSGRKRSHWMWFVFPQLAGLGRSAAARHYGISGLDEARGYLDHPLLGGRLRECTRAALGLRGDAETIFGPVDSLKFRSSMTLFGEAAADERLFPQALDLFFAGQKDERTLALLGRA